MARRKFILSCGQSNANNVGDSKGWEDLNPANAIRSPKYENANTGTFEQGSVGDSFTMPATFPGGPQSGQYATGPQAGTYQTINTKGSTLPAMRWLTFWRPTGIGLNLATTEHTKFPHIGTISSGSTSSRLLTTVRWQSELQDQITAINDGADTFTIGAGIRLTAGGRIHFVAISGGTVPTGVSLNTTYYVINVVGNTFQVSLDGIAPIVIATGPFVAGFYAIPVDIGTIVRRRTGQSYTGTRPAPAQNPSLEIVLDTPMLPQPEANEEFTYEVVSDVLSPDASTLVLRNQYGGVADTGTTFYGTKRVRLGYNGTLAGKIISPHFPVYEGQPVIFTTGSPITLPAEVVSGTTYYVTQRETPGREVTIGGADIANNQFTTAAAHQLVSGERIRLVGTSFPTVAGTPLDGVTIYFVKRIDATTFKLGRLLDSGAEIDFTGPSAGTVTKVVSIDSYTAFRIAATPGGPEIAFSPINFALDARMQVSVSFRGSLSGLQVTCTAGPALNVGLSRPLSDVYYNVATATSRVKLASPFPTAPTRGSKFTIEVPPLHGKPVPFSKWAYWLPYSPFEGSARGAALQGATLSSSTVPLPNTFIDGGGPGLGNESKFYVEQSAQVAHILVDTTPVTGGTFTVFPGHNFSVGDLVYWLDLAPAGDDPPTGVTGNTVYYIVAVPDATSFKISATPGGAVLIPTSNPAPAASSWIGLSSPSLPVGMWSGQPLYATEVGGTAFFFSMAYDGSRFLATESLVRSGLVHITDHEGKRNPFPPGFNYPAPDYIPHSFMPFDGMATVYSPGVTSCETLALELHEHTGETIYVMTAGFGGASLFAREVDPGNVLSPGYGWYDGKQMLSWSPADAGGCFATLLNQLDAAQLAFEAQGDEGECIAIVFLQGETDSVYSLEDAESYGDRTRAFKKAIRAAIKSRNLCTVDADKIPFLHPTVSPPWPYVDQVNAQIRLVASEDRYSRSVDAASVTKKSDGLHYNGAGMDDLGGRFFTELLTIPTVLGAGAFNSVDAIPVGVEISNLALATLGQTAKLFSLDTTQDQSAEAALCARFFPIARDEVIESHPWAFVTRFLPLIAVTKDENRTDWSYAYSLPPYIAEPIEVLPQGSRGAAAQTPGELTPLWRSPSPDQLQFPPQAQQFVIELNDDHSRVLYTNVPDAVIRYTITLDDAIAVPMQFKVAVARRLASLLAGPLQKGNDGAATALKLEGLAGFSVGKAAATDANHQQHRPMPQQMPWSR